MFISTMPPDRCRHRAAALLDLSLQFHCSVCLSEIGIGLGGYSPLASGYAATRNHYRALINQIPDHRLLVPDEQIWLESGIVAGMLWRIQGYKPRQRKDCLNDALIYLNRNEARVAGFDRKQDRFRSNPANCNRAAHSSISDRQGPHFSSIVGSVGGVIGGGGAWAAGACLAGVIIQRINLAQRLVARP